MSNNVKPKQISIGKRIPLPKQNSWNESWHKFDEASAFAIEMALATGRPLLVRGEPGIGKSQLARAVAEDLGRLFISEVVNVSTEGQDLLWRFDPVARLNDAQVITSNNLKSKSNEESEKKDDDPLHQKHYISPGVLWWVFDWKSANKQYEENCRHKLYKPEMEKGKTHKHGVVLLIDEIDKADPALPNSLLEVLGNAGFQVPILNQTVGVNKLAEDYQVNPLVIITTNEERELPPAFLRRCLVLNIKLDDKNKLERWWSNNYDNDEFDIEKALSKWLGKERAEIHFPDKFDDLVKDKVAEYLIQDRNQAKRLGMAKPGQAEYLDLLKALDEMTPDNLTGNKRCEYQLELLKKIKDYALVKSPK